MSKRYFRCKSNPGAPALVLHENWEAEEMRTNLEYDEVDEEGLPVVLEELTDETIPVQFGTKGQ